MRGFRYEGAFAREVSMPVGGIGAGSVGLAGNGALTDWEIENHPAKGTINPFTHFAVKAETKAGVTSLVLQGDHTRDLSGKYGGCKYDHFGFGYGPAEGTMAGFPHFKQCAMTAAFPFAQLAFSDERFPGNPSLTAFSSFIPMNEDDSSLPCAFFTIEIENTTDADITYTAAFTLGGAFKQGKNAEIPHGLSMTEGENGLCVLTDADDYSVQTHWFRGGWFDGQTMYWNQFAHPGFLPKRTYADPGRDRGTVEVRFTCKPGETGRARFLLSWFYPTIVNDWDEGNYSWKNWYAMRFSGATDVGRYAMMNWDRLETATARFRDALYGSSLPEKAIEAAGASLSILVTPVCLRLEDGSFYGWEGASELGGSCEGTCQHVWNYAYALPFLFPALERSARENEKKYSQLEDGRICFRLRLPPGRGIWWRMPCVDGQMGYIMQTYREWKMSGDEGWLRGMWPSVRRALSFAWLDSDVKWDPDRDGVLDGRQHHTLDMELFGPNAWLEGFYLGALKAASEMAKAVGEDSSDYDKLFEKGKAFLNQELFNGEYYDHKVDLTDKCQLMRYDDQNDWNGRVMDYFSEETGELKYQIAGGLIIDQALAQWHANLMDLGEIYDPQKLKTALKSLYKYNFKPMLRDFANPCRVFSLNDEAGTIMCAYPEGAKKPAISVPYCEETMTGFEYAAAGLMIQEGLLKEGERMIAAVRDRYDGAKRNPFNEIECGSNYARSMAAFALIPIYAGFVCDATRGYMRFKPVLPGAFSGLWFMAGSWGTANIGDGAQLTVEGAPLAAQTFELPFVPQEIEIDGTKASFRVEGACAVLESSAIVQREIRFVK